MNAPQAIAAATHDRSRFIGGSDVAAVLGISPWKSRVDLWRQKVAPQEEDGRNAVAKRRGSRLEPYMLDMIREEYGIETVARNQRYVDVDIPYFAAEIDAETADENIELKTVHPFKAGEWGAADSDELPLHYLAQVQWGLGIRRRERARVFALIGDDLRPYVVERDEETIAALRERADEFWLRFVVLNERPPMEYDDPRAIETLKKLYPGTDGTTILAADDEYAWRTVYEEAKEKVSRYEAVANGAKAHLLDGMGEAALLRFDDGKAFRRKLISKKPYVVEYPATSYVDFRLTHAKD